MLINIKTDYIVYTHGSGVRHHHAGSQTNILDETNDPTTPGPVPATASSPMHTAYGNPFMYFSGHDLPFAFMSINGAADGNHLYTDPGNYAVPIGNTDMHIVIVYAPVGGITGPGGGPGVWVDAFNVDAGDFSDSNFISVYTNNVLDAAKTTEANNNGDVSSLTPEELRADGIVDGAPFLEWKQIIPMQSIVNGDNVDLTQNESGEIWLAFYQTVPPPAGIGHLRDVLEEALGKWVDDDYCGTGPHPVGPFPGAFKISLTEKYMKGLSTAQKQKVAALGKEYASAAGEAYKSMAKVSALLKDIAGALPEARG